MELRLPAPAKLNLFLHVTGRRADGYHNLQTVFQFIDWSDALHFRYRYDRRVVLHINGDEQLMNDNIIVRAADALRAATDCTYGVDIELSKRLPIGAGVGGGSSDAATTLLALNKLWDLHLTFSELHDIAVTLGADVPIFVHGHAAWAEGIGDQLTSIILPERHYLLLIPDCHVSTQTIFQHPGLTRDTRMMKISDYQPNVGHNDFESVVRELHPQVADALDWLNQFASARMSGTGCVVFAAFDTQQEAGRIAAQVPAQFQSVVVQGLNRSPLHAALLG